MKKIKIYNYTDLEISGTSIEMNETGIENFHREDEYKYVIILDDPANYFNSSIDSHIRKYKKIKIFNDISNVYGSELLNHIKRYNIMPLMNPLIFNIDKKKE